MPFDPPDPLLPSLLELIAVADETSFSANLRDYGKTRQLQERLGKVSSALRVHRAANRRTRPSETYRWIERLSPTVAACLTEMDSVQSAADAGVVARLDDARTKAATFATSEPPALRPLTR